MPRRRYEIFVSSTFEDLKEERRQIQEYIISQGHLPVGMELFNAGNEDQWHIIQRVIDQCDYYVLIIGGRYGSTKNGVSFTQREYRYAKKLKKPVIAFVLSARGEQKLTLEKLDRDPEKQKLLSAFKQEVESRYVHHWDDSLTLMDKVKDQLLRWMESRPQAGWIRASDDHIRERYVYHFLFNALKLLPPHVSLPEECEDLYSLSATLDSMRSVAAAINALISFYAQPHLEKGMRIYFAYRLTQPLVEPGENGSPFTGVYRIGITNTTELPWRLGILVSENSNIHHVYESADQHNIPDTAVALPDQNQRISRERSVYAAAVTYGTTPIGVIGISAPKAGVTSKYTGFGNQLAVLFGALFYAYGQHCPSASGEQDVATKLRVDIATYFEGELQRARAQARVFSTPQQNITQ